MRQLPDIRLADVQSVYTGPEGRLWELLMGQQIHLGGLTSSIDLASRAGIGEGSSGVDLCCASGAGMRFLLRFSKVGRMTGVDATPVMLELARKRCAEENVTSRVVLVEANVCRTGLPGGAYDFVWGEDAWCYVEDKAQLLDEALRLLRPKGRIAFTDWMEGPVALSDAEADRFMRFMKFPSLLTLAEYSSLLGKNGASVLAAEDTGRFATHMPLYLDMIEKQLTYDALRIIEFNSALAGELLTEMRFIQSLATAGKVIQGLLVAESHA